MGDIVTQLQEEVLSLAAKFYNVIGTLQRDAPPASLSDHGNEQRPAAAGEQADVAVMVQLMAEDLITSFKTIDAMVQRMPCDERSSAEHVAAIVQLQSDNAQLAQELQQEVAQASQVVDYVHGIYRCLAEDYLRPKT